MNPTLARLRRPPRPGPIELGAAAATVVVSVLLDVVAGADLRHVAALAATSVVVGLLRVAPWGRRHRLVAAATSAAVVAQPAVHSISQIWERSAADARPGHGAAHLGLVLLHTAVLAATVLLVAAADVVLLGCAAAIVRIARLLRGLSAEVLGRPVTERFRTTGSTAGHFRDWSAYAARRGPPRPSTC